MKIDFKKIINIKNKSDLKDFDTSKPIFQNNFLFHYMILIGNIDGLKLLHEEQKLPIYIENNDNLNGFHLAAKEDNMEILCYLIENCEEYIYNRNKSRDSFAKYLELEQFSILIKKYPKLDWNNLIETPGTIFKNIIYNLSYIELNKFLDSYKIKPEYTNQYLLGIINNTNLKTENKIKILDKYSDEEINIKNQYGGGLIFSTIEQDDERLFDYLISRNISVDYYTWMLTENPLREALKKDILNNEFKYTMKILKKIDIKNFDVSDKYLDNILHTLFYIRMNRNNMVIQTININYEADFAIIKLATNEMWNQSNRENHTPLELIVHLDYDVYSKAINTEKIQIEKDRLEIIKKADLKDGSHQKKWIMLLERLDKFNNMQNNIILEDNMYSHGTLFQAKFKDVAIFTLYMKDTYKNLLIPNMTSYLINNITFEDSFPFSDPIIAREPIFPWTICYYSENEYYIHPYLNNIINSERRENGKRFALVFLTLVFDTTLHANLLLYDFKNMTIERFEPYGNYNVVSPILDDILEEELTWSTGLKYIRPGDYLPIAGFQTISDENNVRNQKAGDFGGFCLAWCLWYLENRLKNPEVSPKTLVEKLINMMSRMDIKFVEYIRNYSTKINEKRIEYLEKIGIDNKMISNVNLDSNADNKLTTYLINSFSNLSK